MQYLTLYGSLFILCISRMPIKKDSLPNKILRRTYFYDMDGNKTFKDTAKIWYFDSATIQEIHSIDTNTDTANITTVTYRPMFHLYIDLRTRTWYHYVSFSDTAAVMAKGFLPNTGYMDYGWSYFSDNILVIVTPPKMVKDTTIDDVQYRRGKFVFKGDDSSKKFNVGYWRCDGKGNLFSKEKQYSRKIGCTLTKLFSFQPGKEKPYGSTEIDFLPDKLTDEELKVFTAWAKNTKQNPVK